MTYAKAIAAALVAAGASLVVGLDDDHLSGQEWITAAIAILTSAGVVWYSVNGPTARYVKAVVGSLTAVATTLFIALDDQFISDAEYVKVGVAAIVGLGLVYAVPNKTPQP